MSAVAFPASLRWRLWVTLLVGGVALGVGGCDSGMSKRDALYQQLVGTWDIQELRTDRTAYNRVPFRLKFLSREADGPAYRLVRPAPEDTVVAKGRVAVLRSNVLSMTEGFAQPLRWTFDFDAPNELSGTVQFRLQSTWTGSSQAFLSAIGIGGGAHRIELDLVRQ